MHETDAEILDALRKNINKGGELLFKRYYKPLVMFADTFLPGSDVAEDFVQDVFYRFIKDKTFLHMTPDALAREGKIVFQTHGSAGSSVWTPEAEAPVLIPVEAVPNVNPVGAGDAYRGGLLRGLEMGLDPVECAKLGTETARRTLLKRSAG